MFHHSPLSDDVSSIEASRDRVHWASVLLTGRLMPGLQLAANRVEAASRQTHPLVATESRSTAQTQKLTLPGAKSA